MIRDDAAPYAREPGDFMELKHLRAFVALAEELHFGRAAQRLCIVQPALSMQIKALEEELDVRLFERDRHKVALSETGRLFLPEARATLHQAVRAEQTARLSARGEIGTLRIAFVSSVLPKLLPSLIRKMHTRYPLITLELKDMPTPDQIAALRENQLDFGLIRLPVSVSGLDIRGCSKNRSSSRSPTITRSPRKRRFIRPISGVFRLSSSRGVTRRDFTTTCWWRSSARAWI